MSPKLFGHTLFGQKKPGLLPSLFQAIVHVDGDALVMRSGEQPFVVASWGQVKVVIPELTLDSVNEVVQLLPQEVQDALDDLGAARYDFPRDDTFPHDQFTLSVTREDDEGWAEIRRRRLADLEDFVPEEVFETREPLPAREFGSSVEQVVAAQRAAPAPLADDTLALPHATTFWPGGRPHAAEGRDEGLSAELTADDGLESPPVDRAAEVTPPINEAAPPASELEAAAIAKAARAAVSATVPGAVGAAARLAVTEAVPGAVAEAARTAVANQAPAAVADAAPGAVAEAARAAVAEVVIAMVGEAARAAVTEAVAEGVADAARQAVADQAPTAVDEAARAAVAALVVGAVGEAVQTAVTDAVPDAVAEASRTAVTRAVPGAVAEAVRSAVTDAVPAAIAAATPTIMEDAARYAVGLAAPGAVAAAAPAALAEAARAAVAGAVPKAVDEAARAAVAGAVSGAVSEAARRSVSEAIPAAVTEAVRTNVAAAVPDAVAAAVRLAVADMVPRVVRASVADAVPTAVADAARAAVASAVPTAVADAAHAAVASAAPTAVADAARAAVASAAPTAVADVARAAVANAVAAPPAPPRAAQLAQPYDPLPRPYDAVQPTPPPIPRSPINVEPAQPPPAVDAPSDLERLLRVAASRGASTLYLIANARPSVRVDGQVRIIDTEPVYTASDVISLLTRSIPVAGQDVRQTGATTEWIADVKDIGRVRCASFNDQGNPAGVFRMMPVSAVSVDQLGLARAIQSLAFAPDGLILVTGPRASGKRTLISALVDLINRASQRHVISIEREIDIVHAQRYTVISQREVRGNDEDVAAAARAALREDPDVLVLGQIRTGALMTVALEAAASGRLVIAGFSAHSVTESIDRIIDRYMPEYTRRQAQLALADNLRAVIAQVLLAKAGGGRVPAREILLKTNSVARLIAEGNTSQLPKAIEAGRQHGMKPLTDSLVAYVQNSIVDVREACRHATDRPAFIELLKRHGIDTSAIDIPHKG